MRINELIVDQTLEEGVGQTIGKAWGGAMKGIGAVGGGIAGSWDAMKQGYRAGKAAVAGTAGPSNATAGAATPQPIGSAPAPTGGPAPTPTATPGASGLEIDQLKTTLGKLNPEQKKELADELEKSMNTPAPGAETAPAPAGATINPAKAQADRDAKNAADAAERNKQIAATTQANAAAAQTDNNLIAAVKAAKAKPGFQQTAQDKLTIQKGAAKGIHESKKKKIIAEFNSKFLGKTI